MIALPSIEEGKRPIVGLTVVLGLVVALVGAIWDPIVAMAVRVCLVATVLGVPAWLIGLGVIHWRRSSLVWPTELGHLPVRIRHLREVHLPAATIERDHEIRMTTALNPAPHNLSIRQGMGAGATAPSPLADLTAAPTAGQTFRSIMDSGELGRGRIYLGQSAAGPIWTVIDKLYSIGVGGKPGSGKTTTAASLLAQAALSRVKLLVADPHAGDAQSLANKIGPLAKALMAPIASDPTEIMALIDGLYSVFMERKADPTADRTEILCDLEEWTSLMRGQFRRRAPDMLASMVTEGRKYGISLMFSGQDWTKEMSGSGVRNSLTSFVCHQLRADEARMLLGASPPKDVLDLPPGTCYVRPSAGEMTLVKVPEVTREDMVAVGEKLQIMEVANV